MVPDVGSVLTIAGRPWVVDAVIDLGPHPRISDLDSAMRHAYSIRIHPHEP